MSVALDSPPATRTRINGGGSQKGPKSATPKPIIFEYAAAMLSSDRLRRMRTAAMAATMTHAASTMLVVRMTGPGAERRTSGSYCGEAETTARAVVLPGVDTCKRSMPDERRSIETRA